MDELTGCRRQYAEEITTPSQNTIKAIKEIHGVLVFHHLQYAADRLDEAMKELGIEMEGSNGQHE